jgi:hypothetical protein
MTELRNIDTPGSVVTFTNPSREERINIIEHYNALRKQGHAFAISDEHSSDEHAKPAITVHHYKSCKACAKEVS